MSEYMAAQVASSNARESRETLELARQFIKDDDPDVRAAGRKLMAKHLAALSGDRE